MDKVEDFGLKFFGSGCEHSMVSERRLLKWAVLKMWTPRQGSPRNLGLAVADFMRSTVELRVSDCTGGQIVSPQRRAVRNS